MESVIKKEFGKNNLISIFSKYGIIIAFGLIIVILSFATNEFFTIYNIINILRQSSIIGIVAIGMALMIIMGGIDLSVGSLLALSGVVAGMVAHHRSRCTGYSGCFGGNRCGCSIGSLYRYMRSMG